MSRFISTAIPYVNSKPHIGHALEYIQADAYARAAKLRGEEVFFLTGTDDNALKNVQAAEKVGEEVQAFVDKNAQSFIDFDAEFGVAYDQFIRTSGNEAHRAASQKLWTACAEKGDLYKKPYVGYYCVGCEEFKTEKDLINGECPLHHGQPLQKVEEENWFFKLSNYQEKLDELISSEEIKIVPEARKNEMLAFIRGGLEDFSVSRSVTRAKGWGIPVPGDETQIMYVWFDALVNYITAAGYATDAARFKQIWSDAQERTHCIGKDITRFHTIYWPAMLLSAGVPLPTTVFSHGFITSEGHKMSKSIGNVIDPLELSAKYGVDADRYMLLRHVHPTEDTDVTWERLDEWYTANLVNGLGNLVARVMKLCEDNLDVPISEPEGTQGSEEIMTEIDRFSFNAAIDVIFSLIALADERITKEEPFKVVKTDPATGRAMLAALATEVWNIGKLLQPFMPSTSQIITSAVLQNKKPENLFPRLP